MLDLVSGGRADFGSGESSSESELGGFMMAQLNRVPMVADRITADGWRFEIVEMDGRRVDRVLIVPVKAKGRLA